VSPLVRKREKIKDLKIVSGSFSGPIDHVLAGKQTSLDLPRDGHEDPAPRSGFVNSQQDRLVLIFGHIPPKLGEVLDNLFVDLEDDVANLEPLTGSTAATINLDHDDTLDIVGYFRHPAALRSQFPYGDAIDTFIILGI
jgi:hypothetical protein